METAARGGGTFDDLTEKLAFSPARVRLRRPPPVVAKEVPDRSRSCYRTTALARKRTRKPASQRRKSERRANVQRRPQTPRWDDGSGGVDEVEAAAREGLRRCLPRSEKAGVPTTYLFQVVAAAPALVRFVDGRSSSLFSTCTTNGGRKIGRAPFPPHEMAVHRLSRRRRSETCWSGCLGYERDTTREELSPAQTQPHRTSRSSLFGVQNYSTTTTINQKDSRSVRRTQEISKRLLIMTDDRNNHALIIYHNI